MSSNKGRDEAEKVMDPYRIMFPLGLVFAVAGVAVWIIFAQETATFPYPGMLHANLMIGGFMLAFAAGFLGTAAPRLTGTRGFGRIEVAVTTIMGGLLLVSAVSGWTAFFHLVIIVSLVLLISALATRLRHRRRNPPPTLLIAASGLFCGLAGNLAILLAHADLAPPIVMVWGRLAFYHGMMLGLVLGVGSFLVAVLLGWEELPAGAADHPADGVDEKVTRDPAEGESRALTPRSKAVRIWTVIVALTLPISFIADAVGTAQIGGLTRAVMATVTALTVWRLYRLPRQRSVLAFGAWISCWCIVAGLYLYALLPTYGIHAVHIEFIGGFGLLTMVVATRVTLAHGGHQRSTEKRSFWLSLATLSILIAAATRASAALIPAFYTSHLAYAAIAWILGLSFWCVGFLPKMWTKTGRS